MILPAAQPLNFRNQSDLGIAYDFSNMMNGGILNGVVSRDGDSVIVEKRRGFDVTGSYSSILDTGDYIDFAGVMRNDRYQVVFDLSAIKYTLYQGTTNRGDLSTLVSSTVTAKQHYFCTLDDYGIVNSYPGYNLFYTTGGAVTQITGGGTPSAISYGGAVVNGRYYIGDGLNGRIYNSSEGDPSTIGALDFISTNPTGLNDLIAIFRHKDNIVSFGRASVNFFYDNANPSGSPLRRREDVFYAMGATNVATFSELGDRLYFVGGPANDHRLLDYKNGVYVLDNFQIKKISTEAIDNFISGKELSGTCVSAESCGRSLYILTLNLVSGASGKVSLVYDIDIDFWYVWGFQSSEYFPVVGEMGTINGQGALVLADGTTLDGGSLANSQDEATDYKFSIKTPAYNHGSSRRKHCSRFAVLGDYTSTGNWSVRYSDDDYRNYSTARTMSATSQSWLSALGSFYSRAWEVSFTGDSPARVSGFEIDL